MYSLRLIPLPEDFLSDVQTDVNFVPVDTASDRHKQLVLLMSQLDWCSISV